MHGHVVHAWALPPAGVISIAEGTSATSPEIAHRAGWREIPLGQRVQIPIDQISSARAVVEVLPDDSEQGPPDRDPPLLVMAAMTASELILEPRCQCCRH